ncbi:MAG: sugar transferase [Nitrospirae bacterium]|nr:sugar transferase [Nitrospirota bacterium]
MAFAVLLIESAVFFVVFSLLLHTHETSGSVLLGRITESASALVLTVCCVAALYYSDLYNLSKVRTFWTCLVRVFRACVVGMLPIGLLLYATLPDGMRDWQGAAAAFVVMITTVLVSRTLWYHLMLSRPFTEHVVVLGKTLLAQAVIAELQTRPNYRILYDYQGRLNRVSKDVSSIPKLPERRWIDGVIRPTRIVVAMNERRGCVPVEMLLDAKRQGIVIEDGITLYESLTGKLAIETLKPSHLIFAPEFSISLLHSWTGRGLSLFAATLGVVFCAPLLGLIAVLVKLDSPGPILFVQDRVGKDGRQFPLMKFRTMAPIDGSRSAQSEWVKDNDDRITRVGRWLRKFRLDELPQLLNVLSGHMNLVGPRPHPASNYQLFMTNIPFYAFRSLVRPGITGWAQVRYGYANNLAEETEKMRYDLYYIKHRSLGLDLEILLRTTKVVALGREMKPESELVASEPFFDERNNAA